MRHRQAYFIFLFLFFLAFTVNLAHAQQIKRIERVISTGRNDTRSQPPNILLADKFPFRAVVKLFATFRNGAIVEGTGVLVSADGVFTAAHTVYDKDLGGKATKVEIVPAYNGGNKPFGSTYNSRIEVPDEYIQNESVDYDFAAILTTTRIGDTSGWLGYGVPNINLAEVFIIGYPDDDTYDGRTMIQSTSSASLSNKNELHYGANTSLGMSGSPIIIKVGNDYRVIGVHSTGGDADKGENYNRGVRFMDDFLKRF